MNRLDVPPAANRDEPRSRPPFPADAWRRQIAACTPRSGRLPYHPVSSPDYIHVTYGEPHAAARPADAGRASRAARAGRSVAGERAWTLGLVARPVRSGGDRRPSALVRLAALRVRDRRDDRPRVVGTDPRLPATTSSFGRARRTGSLPSSRICRSSCRERFRSPNTISCITATWAISSSTPASRGRPSRASSAGRARAKALWVAGTILIQGIVRPRRMKRVTLLDGWTIVNIVVQVGAHGAARRPGGRRAVQVSGRLDGLRDRPASARRALDSGAFRAGARARRRIPTTVR